MIQWSRLHAICLCLVTNSMQDILALKPGTKRTWTNPEIAVDPIDIQYLSNLIERAEEKQKKFQLDEPPEILTNEITELKKSEDFETAIEGDEFIFWRPIEFKPSCIGCHGVGGEQSNIELAKLAEENLDLLDQKVLEDNRNAQVLFAKIKIPYRKTKRAINWSRAVLMTFAIVTAFFSILALYTIIRFWIVKPLRHLRDVTDEVSHGRTDIRYSLETGDEFEELGRSFNRMLRHIFDTQTALSNANSDLDKESRRTGSIEFAPV